MAIDSRAKRQSAAWTGFPGPVSILPTGVFTQAVRQQIGWTYRGILVEHVDPPSGDGLRLRLLMGVGL